GIEHTPFNLRRIGPWWKTSQAPAAMPILTDDVWLLGRAWSTPSGFRRGARLVWRALGGLVKGQRLAGIGAGLTASFLDVVVIRNKVQLWLESPVEDLILDAGRVVGARVTHEGRSHAIRAGRGVMFAGGGFDANKEWRQKYHG